MTITQGDQTPGDPADPGSGGSTPGRLSRWSTSRRSPSGRPTSRRAKERDNRYAAMVASGVMALALGITAAILPAPYVVESPGPTFNTLANDSGKPVISVSGHETFPAKGNLDLTTVYVDGGPNGPVSVFEAFSAWLDRSKAVYPEELIFPSGVTKEESQQESAVAMATSQENAVASALRELNIPFEQKLSVAGLADQSASAGKLQAGDIFSTVNGKPVTSLTVVQEELAAGRGKPATVVVNRNGAAVTETITPTENSAGKFILGVLLKYAFKFPFEVKISLDKVGGPSAGMMFALGIIDTVTPGDLTGGKHIAGTGTITPEGIVGSIGGIGQKMYGAREDGATVFLAPAGNCAEVVGHIPDGLQVVKVENLAEARDAVAVVGSGGDTSGLPRCTSN